MAIKVACGCKRRFVAQDKLAGKTVKCPKCGDPLSIPDVASNDSFDLSMPVEDAGAAAMAERPCPECGAAMQPSHVVCLECGFNQTLGRKMNVDVGSEKAAGEDAPEAHDRIFWLILVPLAVATVVFAGVLQMQLKGPQFLIMYFIIGAIGFATAVIAKQGNWGMARVCILVVVMYETIGTIRLWYGYTHGMERFSFLYMMMLFGPLTLLFLSKTNWTSSSGTSSFFAGCSSCATSGCSSSCGSSCGGGCGGGGCGGCGGD